MHILVVEDELKVAAILSDALTDAGHDVAIDYSGSGAWETVSTRAFDLVLLDQLLPGISGLELCKRMRESGNLTPVLMVTARDSTSDKVAGLDAGADDYLSKPFSIDELLARVRALLRRQESATASLKVVDDLVVNTNARDVTRAGKAIFLSAKEYELLEFLTRHAGRVVTKAAIAEQVWGIDFDMASNVVEVYISYLRAKIDQKHQNKLIQTVRGVGYQLGKAQ